MLRTNINYLLFLLLIPLFAWKPALGETDTLKITFGDAEKLFLENNLALVAGKYNIAASKALIQQAKLWDNPTLNTEQNLLDGTHKFFNHSNGNGEFYAVLNQVFKTAGKRGREIKLAKDDEQIQEAAFNDLMRNLRYNLLLDFTEAASLTEQNKVYGNEIKALTGLVNAVDKSYQAGNSSFKDAVRLKALLFSLQNDLIENNSELNNLQSELKTLLSLNESTTIVPVTDTIKPSPLPELNTLIEEAKVNRGDFITAQLQGVQAKDNLSYQKSLKIPDLTVGIDYDRINSYSPHYFGLQIGLPIPLFDRNKGNIKAAQLTVKSQESIVKNSEAELRNNVAAAAQQYELCRSMLTAGSVDFYQKYNQLFNGMLKSYQQRQISLIEFIDFFESYKDTQLKIIRQQYNFQKAIAEVNYSVGSTVIKP